LEETLLLYIKQCNLKVYNITSNPLAVKKKKAASDVTQFPTNTIQTGLKYKHL